MSDEEGEGRDGQQQGLGLSGVTRSSGEKQARG
jgi:hypothetical protein